jgi:hypothetical protein
MTQVLAKAPKVVAPWPPPGLEPKDVLPGEDFGAFCKRNKVSFKDLMLKNFQINIDTDKDWEFVCNWYLWHKVGCRSLTPKGNCKFVGGEKLYVPRKAAPRPEPPRKVPDIVEWFMSEIMPKRTIGPGDVSLERGGRVIDHVTGGPPDPNGVCGSAANYVMEQYQEFGHTGTTLGYILWQQASVFTHVANVIMPVSSVLIYEGSDHTAVAVPETTTPLPFSAVAQWTVLDLYFKKIGTVESWWNYVSYVGWGRITLDPDGIYINE